MTKKQNDLQSEQLEIYQSEVEKMQRKMEEARQVAECKIKALQTQNEALRLHLRLAVDSLKNPIPTVIPPSRRTSIGDWGEEQVDEKEELDEYEDTEEEEEEGDEDEERDEIESRLADLLQDLGMFRRKVSDDKGRFLEESYLQEVQANA